MEINSSKRKNSLSGEDKFSFPVINETSLTEESDDQFEFGSHVATTPRSPKNSPADHLFFNGKLLPHSFPKQTCNSNNFSYSRSTSRTSSVSSKDYFTSSRSNSTNSSARTSTSDQASFDPRKLTRASQNYAIKDRYKPVLSKQPCRQYGSSQRWQLIAGTTPVLKHQGSRSKKVRKVLDRKGSKELRESEARARKKSWFGNRVWRGFVSACKRCHAIDETSNVMV